MPDKVIEQLADEFLRLMFLFKNNIFKSFDKMFKNTLSPMQVQILSHLKDRDALSMSELAAEMNILKQQLTFLTDKLAENNFVERVPDTKDRRSIKISITQCGIDFLKAYHKLTLDLLISKFEQMSSEDINELHGAIQSVNKILNRLQ